MSKRNPAAGMIGRFVALAALCCLGSCLGACSSFSGLVADHWPHWAGGMPDDVPPRPGAPGYEEFIAHKPAGKDAAGATPAAKDADSATPAGGAVAPQKANAPASSTGSAPAGGQNVVQGGLY